MSTCTEIATVSLVPGSEIGDPNNPAAKIIKDTCGTLAGQAGMQSIRFGMEVENPNLLQMFIDWESMSKHHEFMASDQYSPFVERLMGILDGGLEAIKLVHVNFQPEGGLKASLSASVTEVAMFYYDGQPADDSYDQVAKFIDIGQNEGGMKITGWSYGNTEEEIEKDGTKGIGAVLTIGWASIEDHMAFRETSAFKENIGLVRQTSKTAEMHHVQAMNYLQ